MMNWVEVQNTLLHWLARRAGLRQQTVELEPGTIMNFWVPKAKGEGGEEEACGGAGAWLRDGRDHDMTIPGRIPGGPIRRLRAGPLAGVPGRLLGSALGSLRVRRCTVVGFRYGGVVSFKLAERWPDLVSSHVVSGSTFAITDSLSSTIVKRLGVSVCQGSQGTYSAATYRKFRVTNCFHRDFLEVMFTYRERAEMLEALVISSQKAKCPSLQLESTILINHPAIPKYNSHTLMLNLELAKNIKEQATSHCNTTATLSPRAVEREGHLEILRETKPPCSLGETLQQVFEEIPCAHPCPGQPEVINFAHIRSSTLSHHPCSKHIHNLM
ncbi:alpha/beta hydrolase fold [Musa troglodytarum]|uniref:Alpha/beta hydrolase fold n=1 Tax=Musa troglodytarum TaxID=320322 RepID=A0A9E7FQX4_9LILI|nr:alpha/beta hydrolase fold [Musa troglodytarum]